jgi:hypothetical protein
VYPYLQPFSYPYLYTLH